MRGDFSRNSFNVGAGFSRVLQQQGRVQLDADVNESQAIQLHMLRTLAADLMGPHAGVGEGFRIAADPDLAANFLIAPGRYYVAGRLCENRAPSSWRPAPDQLAQPWLDEDEVPADGAYIAYLDVWERSVCAAEYDLSLANATPGALREVALGGVDTANRVQLIWQVRLGPVPAGIAIPANGKIEDNVWNNILLKWKTGPEDHTSSPVIMVKAAEQADPAANPCVISPRSSYRGVENQLYRIEVSRSGRAGTGTGTGASPKPATFVWSRSNASDVLAVESTDGVLVRLAEGWRDARSAIGIGDHVELSGQDHRVSPGPGPIRRVTHYDPDTATITLDEPTGIDADKAADGVVLRRWDHVARRPATGTPKIADDHALEITEGEWLTLEDGISVYFGWPPVATATATATGALALNRRLPAYYRKGDYWMFEARVDLGDVVWPRYAPNRPTPVSPHGVERHYAPLAVVEFANNGRATTVTADLRRTIKRVLV